MASSYGIPDEDSVGKKEYFDSEDLLSEKLDILATWIMECQHCIIFTGAGISTSTGIPDFRSGMNTVLKTGPGVWELRDKNIERPRKARTVSSLQAIPSAAHMAIVQLEKEGLVKLVVSQNTDGLHQRSGLPVEALAELHGNTNLEICHKCNAKYLRDFRTRSARKVHDHFTERLCDDPKCRGRLYDSIINFGESLPEYELAKGFEEAHKADLCIALGSSLRVTPAADIPQLVAKRSKKLVIVNLQKTPLHSCASLNIHAMCDEVMIGLMKRLTLPIPKWKLQRRVRLFARLLNGTGQTQKRIDVQVTGLAVSKDIPYSFIHQIILTASFSGARADKTLNTEPYSTHLILKNWSEKPETAVKLCAELHFHGHYGERPYSLVDELLLSTKELNKEYLLCYDPREGNWTLE